MIGAATPLRGVIRRLRRPGQRLLGLADRWLPNQGSRTRVAESAAYWTDTSQPNWAANSHWRDDVGTEWTAIGQEHYERVRARRSHAAGPPADPAGSEFGRVLEWGSGGGANAVVFAPRSREFVAADVSAPSLEECRRQVSRATDAPLTTVLIDSEHPESVLETVAPGSVDLFLCFYVFELLPSEDYALRILRLSHELLAPGGFAEIQVKYRTEARDTRSITRAYKRNLSNMTTFGIEQFWVAAEQVGYEPLDVQLVPVNALDERYAYFGLRKPSS